MVGMEQLWLPTKKGGQGIQHLTALDGVVCKAGLLAAAALAQLEKLEKAPENIQLFKGETGKQLEELWGQLNSTCTCKGACMCEQIQVTSLFDALNAGMFLSLQRGMSVKVADTLHSQLLDRCQAMLACADTRVAAEQHLARLHSVLHSVATAWLKILTVKEQWHIDNDTAKSVLRFMLRLSPGPPSQKYFRCSCGFQGSDGQHAMTCPKMLGVRTVRHNQIQSSVRYGCSKAGYYTSWEPKEEYMQELQFGNEGDCRHGDFLVSTMEDEGHGRRGDSLVSTMEDLLNVVVSVTHPAMHTVRVKASNTPGAAAEERDKAKKRYLEKKGTPDCSLRLLVLRHMVD
jgi:hypothetical protein